MQVTDIMTLVKQEPYRTTERSNCLRIQSSASLGNIYCQGKGQNVMNSSLGSTLHWFVTKRTSPYLGFFMNSYLLSYIHSVNLKWILFLRMLWTHGRPAKLPKVERHDQACGQSLTFLCEQIIHSKCMQRLAKGQRGVAKVQHHEYY